MIMKGLFFNNKSIRGVFLGSSIARIQIEELTYKNKGHVNVLPTAKVLAYNGSALELCNAGSGTGTILYSLDGTSYSSSIPSLIIAGSYTVYYKFQESNFYTESPVYTLNCSINEKLVSATIELSEDIYTYDGTAKTPTVTVKDGATTIDPSEYTVTYSNNTNAGTATVTITDNTGGNYNVIGSTTFTINKADRSASFEDANGYDYIEVAGIKWATKNVGASSATDYGNYYMYGKGSSQYNSSDSSYTGTEDPLDLSVDTARLIMGGSWHMPTKAQFQELTANTTYLFTTINGVHGGKFTASNGNYVFLPAAGYDSYGGYRSVDEYGYYWSSTTESSGYAYVLGFLTGYNEVYRDHMNNGISIRGVLDPSYKSSLTVGETDTITVYTSGNPTITLSSSDTSVATISGMVVTAVGVGTTTITATVDWGSNYNVVNISYTLTVDYNYNGHDYVDLGLPSGTKWATMNVGASSVTDYGNYYMYGKGAAQYNSSDSTYTGTEDPLSSSVDTARQEWGGQWHMPTKAQFEELIANTDYTWVTNYQSSGINGGLFTDKTDSSKVLFFPADGYYENGSQNGVGSLGRYWSSTPYNTYEAYKLYLLNSGNGVFNRSRVYGCSVRGVVG